MWGTLNSYTHIELQKLLDESYSIADVLRKIGLRANGGNYATITKKIQDYNLDLTQLKHNKKEYHKKIFKLRPIQYSIEDILNNKHTNYASSKLLKRLIAEGYKEAKCEICGLTEWNGKPIHFHLHHKDGNHNNNSFENLQVVCPNCHSQTDTYCGKKTSSKFNTQDSSNNESNSEVN